MRRAVRLAACLLLCGPVHAAWPGSPAPARGAENAARGCGDLLAQMHMKPAHARYVGCRYLPDRQGKPLRATYRVEGRFAARVEAHLVKGAGLRRLQRLCCHWEAQPRWLKDARGREVAVGMVSDETVIGTRAEWRGISAFEITVERLTEEI